MKKKEMYNFLHIFAKYQSIHSKEDGPFRSKKWTKKLKKGAIFIILSHALKRNEVKGKFETNDQFEEFQTVRK